MKAFAHRLPRRIIKTVFFFLVLLIVGRILGNPELYINESFASKVCEFIYGDVNCETMYDTLFYIDFTTVMLITSLVYIVAVKVIRKIKTRRVLWHC
jgi:uncharacterized membrane protein YcaP (DUF421 family)